MAQPSLDAQFAAWLAGGAKDFHNMIVPAFPENVRAVDQLGTPLNPTPQIVTEDLRGYDAELDAAAARERGVERGIER